MSTVYNMAPSSAYASLNVGKIFSQGMEKMYDLGCVIAAVVRKCLNHIKESYQTFTSSDTFQQTKQVFLAYVHILFGRIQSLAASTALGLTNAFIQVMNYLSQQIQTRVLPALAKLKDKMITPECSEKIQHFADQVTAIVSPVLTKVGAFTTPLATSAVNSAQQKYQQLSVYMADIWARSTVRSIPIGFDLNNNTINSSGYQMRLGYFSFTVLRHPA